MELAWLLLPVAPLRAADRQPQLTGDIRIYNPSIIEVDGRYARSEPGRPLPRRDTGQDIARRSEMDRRRRQNRLGSTRVAPRRGIRSLAV